MPGGTPRVQNYRSLIVAGALALFILAWPLDRRHLIFTEHSFITGAYTEAGTLSLYASDLVFLLLWIAWFWYVTSQPQEIFLPRRVFWIGFAFIAWVVFRALPLNFSGSAGFSTPLGWYGAVRIAQGFLLAIIVSQVWPLPLFRRVILGALVISGLFQSLLGIGQVLYGADFGLRFLGEHQLSLQTPGVAKVDIITYSKYSGNVPIETSREEVRLRSKEDVPTGTKVLRAYGTFPHSNVLASFLLSSLVASYAFHRGMRGTRETLLHLFLAVPFVLSVGLLMTFSRSGWLSFLFLLGTLWGCSYRNTEARRKALFFFFSVTLGILILLLFPTLRSAAIARIFPEPTDTFIQGRISSFHNTLSILARDTLFGVGTGNGFIELVRNAQNIDIYKKHVHFMSLEPWQYQYPHAMFLVIFVELGAVGLILFLAFLYEGAKLFVTSVRNLSLFARTPISGMVLVILAVAVLGFADHYLWTIQQGRMLFWGAVGVLLSSASRNEKNLSSP